MSWMWGIDHSLTENGRVSSTHSPNQRYESHTAQSAATSRTAIPAVSSPLRNALERGSPGAGR
jgi:hypothetical protein